MRLTKYDVKSLYAVKALIDKNYQQHIIIPDLATEAAMSTTRLKVGFKQVFAVTIHEYLLQVRMEKAKTLLEGTHLLIKRIAIQIGYKNSTSFINAFKKMFSLTPEEYRRGERRA
jgi:AraC-like DNA-binding protein